MKKLGIVLAAGVVALTSLPTFAAVPVAVFEDLFVRGTGEPITEVRTFQGDSGPATITLVNGGAADSTTERVSSSEIRVNGILIFGPSNFNQNVSSLGAEVMLNEGDNTLEVLLKGKPGGTIQIEIEQTFQNLMAGSVLYDGSTPVEIVTLPYQTDEGIAQVKAASGRIVVLFDLEVPRNIAAGILTQNGGIIIETIPSINFFVAQVPPGSETNFLDSIREQPSVKFAGLDLLLIESSYTATPVEGLEDHDYLDEINAPTAWGWADGRNPIQSIRMGIIDVGFDGLDPYDNDFDGRLEYPDSPGTGSNHGTQVLSIAAAAGNTDYSSNIGINWSSIVRLSSSRVYDKCPSSFHFEELTDMVNRQVNVINISLGMAPLVYPSGGEAKNGQCEGTEQYLQREYIDDLSKEIANISGTSDVDFIVINAAGNDNCNLERIEKPANLLIVGGSLYINEQLTVKHPYSNYGDVVDIAAPYIAGKYYDYDIEAFLPDPLDGTSFSAPMVAGAAAFIWEYHPGNLTGMDVVNRLLAAAQGEIEDFAGVLNIYGALDAAAGGYPNEIVETISVGDNPQHLAVTPNGNYVYVTNWFGDSVSVIQTSDNTVIKTIPLFPSPNLHPDDIAVTPNGSHVYVTADSNATVYVIRTSDNTVIKTIPVGFSPTGITVAPNGYVYVANTGDDTVSVIRTSDNVVTRTIPVGAWPHYLAVTPDGSYVYVTNHQDNSVSVIQTSNNTVIKTIPLSGNAYSIDITPNGEYVYVTNNIHDMVSVIRTSDNSIIETIPVGDNPLDLDVTPNGKYIYVSSLNDGYVSIIDTTQNIVIDAIYVGNWPEGVAVTPDGYYVYVTNRSADTVTVIGQSE